MHKLLGKNFENDYSNGICLILVVKTKIVIAFANRYILHLGISKWTVPFGNLVGLSNFKNELGSNIFKRTKFSKTILVELSFDPLSTTIHLK